jgi:hypothetical protein
VLKVSDDKAGRKGKCPKCKGSIAIPGVEASSAEELVSVAEPESAPDMVETAPAAPAEPERSPAPLSSPASPKRPRVPRYNGVLFLGTLYMVLGGIACIGGAIVLGIGLTHTSEGMAVLMTRLTVGLPLIIAGLMLIGFGQLFYCIRDMAQNSFCLRDLMEK